MSTRRQISQDGAVGLRPPLATLYGDDDHRTPQRHWMLIQPASTVGRHWLTKWATMRNGVDEDGCRAGLGKFSTRRPPRPSAGEPLPEPWYSTTPPHNCQYFPSSLLPQTCILAEKHSKRSFSYNHNVLYLHGGCRQSISLTSYFADLSCRQTARDIAQTNTGTTQILDAIFSKPSHPPNRDYLAIR